MPKHDFLSPKAIGNRIKSIGLQKLRWYCQMCEKQCRDENGFKCHLTSDGHLRQMRVFADNPNRFVSDFSRDFERGYLEILSHRHGTKRVKANLVYQEYIADKNHVHMNSTAWSTLTGFIQHLSRDGKAIVDETEKGWFIQYIDRDPKVIAKQAENERRKIAEINEEARNQQIIETQVALANKRKLEDEEKTDIPSSDDTNTLESNNPTKVAISLQPVKKFKTINEKINSFHYNENENEDEYESNNNITNNYPTTAIEQIMIQEEKRKQDHINLLNKSDRSDNWIQSNIYVKIMNKKLQNGKYYGQKGVIIKVIDKYIADVELNDGSIVRLDQADLETVIPKVGGNVLLLNGAGRGYQATVQKINVDEYNCDLLILAGPLAKREIKVPYEDFSKLFTE
eukprot:gene17034-22542_t